MASTDPQYTQLQVLEAIEKDLIIEPTNPFNILLSQIVESAKEVKDNLRIIDARRHVSKARTREDLYYHLSDVDSGLVYSIPAKTDVFLQIPLKDITTYGVINDNVYGITIPAESTIQAGGLDLLITNDVEIKLTINNGIYSIWASMLPNNTSTTFKEIGSVPTSIQVINGEYWAFIRVPVLQCKVITYHVNVSTTTMFEDYFQYTDKFYDVVIINDNNGTESILKKHYIESVYNQDVPSIYINVGEQLKLKMPYIFSRDSTIVGKLIVKIYTTQAKVIKHLSLVEKWSFTFGETVNNFQVSAKNCFVSVTSNSVLDGGVNAVTFKDLKNKLVHRLTTFSIPITSKQLQEVAKQYAMTIYKSQDTLTDRRYIALADNISNGSHLNYSTSIFINDTSDLPDKVITTLDYTVVDSHTLTKGVGESVTIVNRTNLAILEAYSFVSAIREYNNNAYLSTMFRHVVDHNQSLSSRVYDVDSPQVDYISIAAKSINIPVTTNINNLKIVRNIDTNIYSFIFELIGTDNYDINTTKLVLHIESVYGGVIEFMSETIADSAVIATEHNVEGDVLVINVEMSRYINEADQCRIINGVTNAGSKLYTNSRSSLYILTNDVATIADSNTIARNFYINEVNVPAHMCITKQIIDLNLYQHIKYIWSEVSNTFNEREYQTYQSDVLMTYDADIYETDPNTGCQYALVDTDADGNKDTAVRTLLHSAGDPVMQNGIQVVKHNKGEYILAVNGQPVLINREEMTLTIGAVMYEYIYTLSDVHQQEVVKSYELLRSRLFSKLDELNSVTLDNTVVQLKTKNTLTKVKDVYGKEYDRELDINIIIYVDTNGVKPEASAIRETINDILPAELGKSYVNLERIEQLIQDKLSVIAIDIKIDALDKITKLIEGGNRFTIPKKLTAGSIITYIYGIDIQDV